MALSAGEKWNSGKWHKYLTIPLKKPDIFGQPSYLQYPGDPDWETVLDQLYRAYAESHEADPPGIRDESKKLE